MSDDSLCTAIDRYRSPPPSQLVALFAGFCVFDAALAIAAFTPRAFVRRPWNVAYALGSVLALVNSVPGGLRQPWAFSAPALMLVAKVEQSI